MIIPCGKHQFEIDTLDWFVVREQPFYIIIKNGNPYVRTKHPQRGWVYLAAQIKDFPSPLVVDHKNGDTLDNRQENLRVITRGDNTLNQGMSKNNTSGFKGVRREGNVWSAQVKRKGVYFYLGCFKTKEEAARAYDRKAIELFGEFARTNEMMDNYV
jgi:hypothetical protein